MENCKREREIYTGEKKRREKARERERKEDFITLMNLQSRKPKKFTNRKYRYTI